MENMLACRRKDSGSLIMGVRISMKSDFESTKVLSKIEAIMEQEILEGLYQIWKESVNIIIREKYDTGNMAGSTHVTILTPLSGTVTTEAYYGMWQHEGFIHHGGGTVQGAHWFDRSVEIVWPKMLASIKGKM